MPETQLSQKPIAGPVVDGDRTFLQRTGLLDGESGGVEVDEIKAYVLAAVHAHANSVLLDAITEIFTTEQIEDIVGALFQNGTHSNITATYNDGTSSIDLTVSGGGTPLTQENVEDFVAGVSTIGNGINIAYDDGAGTLTFSLSGESFTTALKNKLTGIADNATANSTDADLRDRSTHSGQQLAITISNWDAAGAVKKRQVMGDQAVSVDYDFSNGPGGFTVTLTGHAPVTDFANLPALNPGEEIVFHCQITQGAGGPFVPASWGSTFRGIPTLSTTVGDVDLVAIIWDGTHAVCGHPRSYTP